MIDFNYINSHIKSKQTKYSNEKAEIIRLSNKKTPIIDCLQETHFNTKIQID